MCAALVLSLVLKPCIAQFTGPQPTSKTNARTTVGNKPCTAKSTGRHLASTIKLRIEVGTKPCTSKSTGLGWGVRSHARSRKHGLGIFCVGRFQSFRVLTCKRRYHQKDTGIKRWLLRKQQTITRVPKTRGDQKSKDRRAQPTKCVYGSGFGRYSSLVNLFLVLGRSGLLCSRNKGLGVVLNTAGAQQTREEPPKNKNGEVGIL